MNNKVFAVSALVLALAACDDNDVTAGAGSIINLDGTVTVSGPIIVGNDLTAEASDTNGLPDDITYIWNRDGVPIVDETTNTLTLSDADVDTTITAQVVYTDLDGFDENVTSLPTELIEAIPLEPVSSPQFVSINDTTTNDTGELRINFGEVTDNEFLVAGKVTAVFARPVDGQDMAIVLAGSAPSGLNDGLFTIDGNTDDLVLNVAVRDDLELQVREEIADRIALPFDYVANVPAVETDGVVTTPEVLMFNTIEMSWDFSVTQQVSLTINGTQVVDPSGLTADTSFQALSRGLGDSDQIAAGITNSIESGVAYVSFRVASNGNTTTDEFFTIDDIEIFSGSEANGDLTSIYTQDFQNFTVGLTDADLARPSLADGEVFTEEELALEFNSASIDFVIAEALDDNVVVVPQAGE